MCFFLIGGSEITEEFCRLTSAEIKLQDQSFLLQKSKVSTYIVYLPTHS